MSGLVPAAEKLGSYQQFVNTSNPVDNLNWIRQSFMLNTVSDTDISKADMEVRIATTAAWKFTDTTLGGHYAINMPPQFTEYADITMGGDASQIDGADPDRPRSSPRTMLTTSGGFGMGRYYSEAIDDNSQLITMAFGVQAFNSLTSFFGNFFDPRASQLVRTGRSTGAFFKLGQVTGALLSIPFLPFVAGSSLIKYLKNVPATKFCYFKPTMPLYFNAVNNILNAITANIGIHSRQLSQTQQLMYVDPNQKVLSQQTAGQAASATLGSSIMDEIASLHKFLPYVYSEGGGIDVYAVATRAQTLADAQRQRLQKILDDATDLASLKQRLRDSLITGNLTAPTRKYTRLIGDGQKPGWLDDFLSSPGGQGQDNPNNSGTAENLGYDSTPDGNASPATQAAIDNALTGTATSTSGDSNVTANVPENKATPKEKTGVFGQWWQQFWDSLKSDIHDGSQFVTFRTDYGGSIGESFSNSMRSSDLEEKINSLSSQSRMTRFDMADGNLSNGFFGTIVNGITSTVGDLLSGVAAGLQLSGVAALAGAAYVDIPKMYDSSSCTLPSQTFTIELKSWSGHRLALLQNIYLPLAMLLAGVLPRSTGPQSFNGPFSCQIFAKGRMQVRNGIITELSITRGTDNVGWTQDNLPLGVEVTFSVTDFSSVLHMPIIAQSGFFDKAAAALGSAVDNVTGGTSGTDIAAIATMGMYSDDSIFTDYLAVLSGLSWQDQTYATRKFSIYRDKMRLNFDSFKSPSHTAGWAASTLPGRLISSIVYGSDRP